MKNLYKMIVFVTSMMFFLGLAGCSGDSGKSSPAKTTVKTNQDGTVTIKIEEGGNGLISCNGKVSTDSSSAQAQNASQNAYYQNFPSSVAGDSDVATIKYIVTTDTAGDYVLDIRYAFGGNCDYLRDAYVLVNGERILTGQINDTLNFDYTVKNWSVYSDATVTIPLAAGDNTITLEAAVGETRTITYKSSWANWESLAAVPDDGQILGKVVSLPNIDYMSLTSTATGVKLAAGSAANAYYTLTVVSENEEYGTVDALYESLKSGSSVTVKSNPKDGYVFDCWYGITGNTNWVGSNDSEFTFDITNDTSLKAHFIPAGATKKEGLVGFGTVCDDGDTTYTITGGLGGETITIASLDDLKNNAEALSGNTPYIVKIFGTITTTDNKSIRFNVGSNKSIYGDIENQGRLKNIEFIVHGENVIIRNMMFGEVISYDTVPEYDGDADDALSLNGATHVWLDHCEFQSHLSPQDNSGNALAASSLGVDDEKFDKDWYDGLLDIKNGAAFITISNNYFHDHWKACLCGSSDTTENGDKKQRLTFYANRWEEIYSRQPKLRYGKFHIVNDYHRTTLDGTGIECSAGANAYVQNSVFDGFKIQVGWFNNVSETVTGYWNLSGNTGVTASSNGKWKPSYTLDAMNVNSVKTYVETNAGVGKLTASDLQ